MALLTFSWFLSSKVSQSLSLKATATRQTVRAAPHLMVPTRVAVTHCCVTSHPII